MTDIFAWGKGKPFVVAMFGPNAASAAESAYELLEILRTGKRLDKFGKVPPIEEWLSYYRDHEDFLGKMADMHFPTEPGKIPTSEFIRKFLAEWRKISRMSQDELSKLLAKARAELGDEGKKEIAKAAGKALAEQAEEIKADIEGNTTDDPDVDRRIKASVTQYFLRVWTPCILVHRKYPVQMLAIARRGDIEALIDLIKIDKAIIHEPRIAQLIHEKANMGNRGLFNKIARAFYERMPSQSLRDVKIAIGGFMYRAFGNVHFKLNTTDIRNLFDAIASACTHGEKLIDDDLSEAQETHSKAIYRSAAKWKTIIPKNTA